MLQSPGVELGQAELGLQDLEASFPRAPSPLGRSLGPWASQGGLAGLLQARRVPPGLGTSCSGSTCLGGLISVMLAGKGVGGGGGPLIWCESPPSLAWLAGCAGCIIWALGPAL